MAKKNPNITHDELCHILAGTYYTFLKAIIFANPPAEAKDVYNDGIKCSDCKGHFLSNAYLTMYDKHYINADWIYHTEDAKKILDSKNKKGLHFEHIVPKERYIQDESWKLVKNGDPDAQSKIEDLLKKYWYIAVITTQENKRLLDTKMPDGWDTKDIFARYKQPKDGGAPIQLYDKDGKKCF
ncbi:MAG: hypothetical protein J6V73_03205 [Spirochaetaceae bacterium]|nr:hypothetical protein [Spirochaetaceae bacterium]